MVLIRKYLVFFLYLRDDSYILNTQCFSKENLKEFIDFLESKFNLEFTIKADNSLYLRHISNENMSKILIKYNECLDMNYKCHH